MTYVIFFNKNEDIDVITFQNLDTNNLYLEVLFYAFNVKRWNSTTIKKNLKKI